MRLMALNIEVCLEYLAYGSFFIRTFFHILGLGILFSPFNPSTTCMLHGLFSIGTRYFSSSVGIKLFLGGALDLIHLIQYDTKLSFICIVSV